LARLDRIPAVPKSVFTDAHRAVIEHLTRLRKARQVSQVELARRLGRPQQFVSIYERGERRIDLVEFYAVVKALGADPEQEILELLRTFPENVRI
jgi:transcriptional regulator with XRE-family HTH domain